MKRRTVFSPCRTYRYVLWRELDTADLEYALVVGLNPSTADEVNDDPTIRACMGFARRWGCGWLCMVNLFAYRATKPRDLKAADAPVGPDNDRWLRRLAARASLVVAAWGNEGSFAGRDARVIRLLGDQFSCLGMTKQGQPRHPLYVKRVVRLEKWKGFA
jgi:hypothetical protein